jgi:replicative DNA helicase
LLSDLRESGAIEQMQILYPFIPSEYYKIDEWDDDEASPTGQAEIMIAKHRGSSIENVRLKFIGI